MTMKPSSVSGSRLFGNLAASKFYVAAPPNSQPDSLHQVTLHSGVDLSPEPGDTQGWQSRGSFGFATDTTESAEVYRVEVFGDTTESRTRARVNTYSNVRSVERRGPWYFTFPLTVKQHLRNGHVVTEVNGTFIDSLDQSKMAIPDTARTVLDVMNMADPQQTNRSAVFEGMNNVGYVQQVP
jgi:hypothetical protein